MREIHCPVIHDCYAKVMVARVTTPDHIRDTLEVRLSMYISGCGRIVVSKTSMRRQPYKLRN